MTKAEFTEEIWTPSLRPLIKTHNRGYPPDDEDRAFWYKEIKRFSVKTVTKAMIGLTLGTDYKPTVKMLVDACNGVDSSKKKGDGMTQSDYKKHSAYMAFLKRYDAHWKKFCSMIEAEEELPDDFKEAKRIADGYIHANHTDTDLRAHILLGKKEGLIKSYRGLFCEVLAGNKEELKGEKKGNLKVPLTY